jgi:RHS repeat-associated protein
MQMYNTNVNTNNYGFSTLQTDRITFYPNGFMNMNQNGEYTKHYYAETQRIASKIGTGSVLAENLCDNLDSRYNVAPHELDNLRYQIEDKTQRDLTFTPIPETWVEIENNDISICDLQGNGNNPENELYFYHGNHLSSTQMVTDMYGYVVQQVHYAPFGEVITEYNAYWHNGLIPDYMFNGKELDEESGMYYYEARYYNPNLSIFISRDPLFEVKPWMNPYAYTSNNPINRIDPSGLFDTESEAKAYKKEHHIKGRVKFDGDSWSIQNRRNNTSIFRDKTNSSMAGKDENGIVTSALVSASAGRGGYRLTNKGGVGHSDETPKTNRDISSIDISILWDWATELGRILHDYFGKKESTPIPQNPEEILQNRKRDEEFGTEGEFGVIVRQGNGFPNYYEIEKYKGSKDSMERRSRIVRDTNRRLDKVRITK